MMEVARPQNSNVSGDTEGVLESGGSVQRELEPWYLELSESGRNKEKEVEGEGTGIGRERVGGTEGQRERENVFKVSGCFAFSALYFILLFCDEVEKNQGKGET